MVTFNVGDKVRITRQNNPDGFNWFGFEATVDEQNNPTFYVTYLHPLTDRPDGYSGNFYWENDELELVDPAEPDYLNMILSITDAVNERDSTRLESELYDWYTILQSYNERLYKHF